MQNSRADSLHRNRMALLAVLALYVVLTLPYAVTKLNGDEAHFVTLPYLMLGGDYTLSAVKSAEFGTAIRVAAESYGLAWHYLVRPADAPPAAAASLENYSVRATASDREKPFVFTADYFTTHRKAGKPLLGFLLNVPALGITYLLPRDLHSYQRDHIYHPAFLAPRLVVWLQGLLILLMLYRIVGERVRVDAGVRAALLFAMFPVTVVWSADLHQDVPLTFFLVPYFYFLWKQRWAWAAVFWGLAFATKNQAVLALAPILLNGIWEAAKQGDLKSRTTMLLQSSKTLMLVVFLGTLVSVPFGHPLANWTEVFSTSALDITEIHDPRNLLYRLPIWGVAGMLALLAFQLLDHARDSFDRMHVFFLAVGALFYFLQDYRSYMFVPSMAIVAGSYMRPFVLRFVIIGCMLVNLAGLYSPYLTSRRLLYKQLNQPGAPQSIEEIERLPGIGSIGKEQVPNPDNPTP
jgi:hypothetical protein